MKRLTSLMVAGLVLAVAGTASAAEPTLFGGSDLLGAPAIGIAQQADAPPAPAAEGTGYTKMKPGKMSKGKGKPKRVHLYHCVEYEDLDNIAPCAVPKIVWVRDPCACHDPCSCCQPKCVAVKICVPHCGCAKVKVKDHGRKVEYDYGEYKVEIESEDGVVKVDYDD